MYFPNMQWQFQSKKGGPEMKNAFELLFQISNPRKPNKLKTDAGKEFLNMDVKRF